MGGAMSLDLYPFSESLRWWKLNCYFVFVTCQVFAIDSLKLLSAFNMNFWLNFRFRNEFQMKLIPKKKHHPTPSPPHLRVSESLDDSDLYILVHMPFGVVHNSKKSLRKSSWLKMIEATYVLASCICFV